MLSKEQNDLLTRVGPGTPAGEMFRRYWIPVGISSEIGDVPRKVRILGEDLALFRDDKGRPGLVGLQCPHRLTSFEYGRVECGGIRCIYHGWKFSVDGEVLEGDAGVDEFPADLELHTCADVRHAAQRRGGAGRQRREQGREQHGEASARQFHDRWHRRPRAPHRHGCSACRRIGRSAV